MSETPNPFRFAQLRNAFLSGFMLLAPFLVTCWVFFLVFKVIGGGFRDYLFFFLPSSLREQSSLSVVWNILATAIVVVLITVFGYVSRYVLGRYFGGLAERFIQTIPGVNGVYNTVKQMVTTFGTQNRNLYTKVVLVEFPRKGVHTIGFLTSKAQGEAQASVGGELWTVFVPTTPNPTSGYLLLIPKDEIVELEMSVGDGMKVIVSGGAAGCRTQAAKLQSNDSGLGGAGGAVVTGGATATGGAGLGGVGGTVVTGGATATDGAVSGTGGEPATGNGGSRAVGSGDTDAGGLGGVSTTGGAGGSFAGGATSAGTASTGGQSGARGCAFVGPCTRTVTYTYGDSVSVNKTSFSQPHLDLDLFGPCGGQGDHVTGDVLAVDGQLHSRVLAGALDLDEIAQASLETRRLEALPLFRNGRSNHQAGVGGPYAENPLCPGHVGP